jgi:DnaJ-domain-containing protein 1
MSLDAIQLTTVEELYAFVEMAIPRTGLVLDADALFRPWARAVSAECKDVRWVYPSRPLSDQLLRHLANFAHRPLPDKAFVLFQKGQLVKVVDVNAVEGSSRPDRLGAVVQEAFAPKRRSRARPWTLPVDGQGNPNDPYQVLGANEMDSDEEIKKKYKQMVMQYHPDRVAHLGPELKDLAARKTTEINCAFDAIRRMRGL